MKKLHDNPPCKLSVNINKIATLRNSRGGDMPDLLECTKDLIKFGAQGITVHPRPDGRHIRKADVAALYDLLNRINKRRPEVKKIEFNIEGFPSREYIKMIDDFHPNQATLVPDPPEAITSNAGWKLTENEPFLKDIIEHLQKRGTRVSLFIDPYKFDKKEEEALERIQPDCIELYTEKYAKDYSTKSRAKTLAVYKDAARRATSLGLKINAGHDLNSKNLRYLLKNIPDVIEVSIGHAIICESLYWGFKKTLATYLEEIRKAR